MENSVDDKIAVALKQRQPLIDAFKNQTNAWRLIHSGADGFDGITVDVLDNVLVVEKHRESVDTADLVCALTLRYPNCGIVLKERWSRISEERGGMQVAGPACLSVFEVLENGLRFRVRLFDEEHIGIFIDSRLPREWVRNNSDGKRVLNLFAYTGGFGMAAMAGGAVSTVNIDNKNSALHFAKENYRRNQLPFDSRTFFKCDVLYYLKRAATQKGRFDLVVVDPPPRFKRRRQRDFWAHQDYGWLLSLCIGVLADGGTVLAGLNALRASDDSMHDMIAEAAKATGQHIVVDKELTTHGDFPATPDRPTSRFRVLRVGAKGPVA